MKQLFLLLIALTSVSSISHAQKPIDNVAWLVGTWEDRTTQGFFAETWARKNDTTYTGNGIMVMGKDTVFSESLEIKQHGKDLYYIATVADQNGGKPVEFKMTSSTTDSLVFENPAHDFPQKITYIQSGKNGLVVYVSGMEKGVARSEVFELKRAE